MVEFGGTLLVGGAFTRAGEMPANRLAQWNGTTWAEATSVNSNVNAMVIRGDGLPVIGGQFTMVQGAPANKVAEFTWGAGWHGLPVSMSPGGNVTALAVMGEDLYIGGSLSFQVSMRQHREGKPVRRVVGTRRRRDWQGNDDGHQCAGSPRTRVVCRGDDYQRRRSGGALDREMGWDELASDGQWFRDDSQPTVSALAVFRGFNLRGRFVRARWRETLGSHCTLDSKLRITGGSFGVSSVSLNAETMPGLKLRLDGSSDLSTWVPVESVKSYSGVETLTDANPARRSAVLSGGGGAVRRGASAMRQ